MISGVGVDIVAINRIAAVLERHGQQFVDRLLTAAEQNHWAASGSRVDHLAGIWAAKEAVAKAIGTGFRGFGLRDVVIVHDEWGKPGVVLMAGALHEASSRSIGQIMISISHSADQAIAFAVAM